MKKNKNEILELENLEKFDVTAYQNDLKKYNSYWRNYWEKELRFKYKDNNLLIKVDRLTEIIDMYEDTFENFKIQNENLLNENIELGMRMDELKHINNELYYENETMKNLTNVKPKGFFDFAKKLINKNIDLYELKNENIQLKQINQTTQTRIIESKNVIFKAIDTEVVTKMLELRIQGKTCTEIATITKVSQSTVSRYLQKNKERLNQLEQSNCNLTID